MKLTSMFSGIDAAGVGVIAAGLLATYTLGIAPARQAVASAASDEAAVAKSAGEATKMTHDVEEAKDRLAKTKTELAACSTHLGTSSQLNARIARITELAASEKLQISEVDPGAELSGPRFNQVPIRITGGVTYPSLAVFLSKIHGAFPDIQVVSVTLTGKPDAHDQLPHFETQLSWYTSADPAGKEARNAGAVPAAAIPAPAAPIR